MPRKIKPSKKSPKKKTAQRQRQKQTVNVKVNIDQSKRTTTQPRQPKGPRVVPSTLPPSSSSHQLPQTFNELNPQYIGMPYTFQETKQTNGLTPPIQNHFYLQQHEPPKNPAPNSFLMLNDASALDNWYDAMKERGRIDGYFGRRESEFEPYEPYRGYEEVSEGAK